MKNKSTKRKSILDWKHTSLYLAFLLFWITPVTYSAITQKKIPYAGKYLNYMYNLSCLFTGRVPYWQDFYVKVIYTDGDNLQRAKVESIDYFGEMQPFGQRSRLYRVIESKFLRGKYRDKFYTAVAHHIVKKYREKFPDHQVSMIRYITVDYPVGSDELCVDPKAWKPRPFSETPIKYRKIIGTVRMRM